MRNKMRLLRGVVLLGAFTYFGLLANMILVNPTAEKEIEAYYSFLNAYAPLDDDRPVVPLRSQAQKDFAQLCARAHRGAVYVKHFRKAGGSSLYSLLNKYTCDHSPVFASELPFFNATHGFSALGNATVYITSLRHPIDRILSMYWFEGRWPRTCNKECEDKKIKDDTTKVADLDEWIEAVYHQEDKYELKQHTACGQWQSVENYYTRQLLGIDRGDDLVFLNKTLTVNDLHRAKEILASFDLVMIQERYQSDAAMARMFQTITATKPSEGVGLPHTRKGLERTHEPSRKDLQRLHELNRFDMELYQYAKKLSRQTVDRWVQQEAEAAKRWTQRNVQELEAHEAYLIRQCVPPPRILSPYQSDTMLGGKGCLSRPFFYFAPREGHPLCLYHSNIH